MQHQLFKLINCLSDKKNRSTIIGCEITRQLSRSAILKKCLISSELNVLEFLQQCEGNKVEKDLVNNCNVWTMRWTVLVYSVKEARAMWRGVRVVGRNGIVSSRCTRTIQRRWIRDVVSGARVLIVVCCQRFATRRCSKLARLLRPGAIGREELQVIAPNILPSSVVPTCPMSELASITRSPITMS